MEGFIWWHHLALVTTEGLKLEDTWVRPRKVKAAVNTLEQWARPWLSISVFMQQTSSQAPPSSGHVPLSVHCLYGICHMHLGVWTRKEGWVTQVTSRPLQSLPVTVSLVMFLVTDPCGHGPPGSGAKLLQAALSFWG